MAARPDEETPLLLELHNPCPHEALFHLVVYWGSLPERAILYLAFGEMTPPRPFASLSKKDLEQAGLRLGDRKARELFEALLEERCGERLRLDLDRIYRLFPDEHRKTTIPEMLIKPDRPAVAALKLVLPKKPDGAPSQFDVVQMARTCVVGGCTFMVRRG